MRDCTYAMCFLLMSVICSGCGSDPYKSIGMVTGTVTCDGKPAEGGTVLFTPIDAPSQTGRKKNEPGRISKCRVAADGTYTLILEQAGGDVSGALTGPHSVTFLEPRTTPLPPGVRDHLLTPEEAAKDKIRREKEHPVFKPLNCGKSITPAEVTVKLGKNIFDFTLGPAAVTPQPNATKQIESRDDR